ncbi:MAG TPA: PIG-L deacetylase family protein [Acidimicrobiales bacterium]|nr:PIG-L deacetylase family protein [Acidimicrobiales bacterium]
MHDVIQEHLPFTASVLAVCAHPDDESFGLGATLSSWADQGSRVSVLSFTHGEASMLGVNRGNLHRIRGNELATAADELGVETVRLLEYPDGRLTGEPAGRLSADVHNAADLVDASLLLVFDEGGITGHLDHVRATEVARAVAGDIGIPVLGWALPEAIAAQLNDEFPTTFVGRRREEIDLSIEVDRSRQQRAIHCHASQSSENPVLWRRLELQGHREVLRWLDPGDAVGSQSAT